MDIVDKIAEPKDPLVLAARKVHNLEPPLPIPIKASWKGKTSQEQEEKDLPVPDDGQESFRSLDSSDEGGPSAFSGASHPLEPIEMDLMKTVYVAVDEEKPEPPVCLLRGLSVKGPFLDDLSLRVTGMKANASVCAGGAEGLAEERKLSGAAVVSLATARSSQATEVVSLPPDSEEKDCVWDASLPPSGNVSPHSSIDSMGVVTAMSIVSGCSNTYKSEAIASSRTMLAVERNCASVKGSVRGDSLESAKTSISRASDSSGVSDDSSWSHITGSTSKPHKGNDPRGKAIHAVRVRDGVLGMSHFRLLKRLGCGDIGSVYLSELSGTRCYFAMKVMDKASLASRKKLNRAQTEREILQLLDHPFLPAVYAYFETDGPRSDPARRSANHFWAMSATATRPGGRFWVISEDRADGDELSDDDEGISDCERTPPTATLTDAFRCAKERRSKQKRGRKADVEEIARRLRDVGAKNTSVLSAVAPPFTSRSGSPPAFVDGRPPAMDSDEVSNWFQIVRG